jgi:DNA (cytosine-5)-methyltransferase 1
MKQENNKEFKVLNLYACLGGNRAKWTDCEVTAVELDPEAAHLYQERFPNDTVIVADAHQYLLDHYSEFDFIWSSPPCPSHSRARYWGFGKNGLKPEYPDMKLYEEIIFLQHHFFGKWVVENVNPYYEPLIPAQKRERHLYWANFQLPNIISYRNDTALIQASRIQDLCDFHDYDFRKYKGKQRLLKMARNLVDYEAGLTIFNTARGIIQKSNTIQTELF